MSETKTAEILARSTRYTRTESVVDDMGRKLTVRRLKPSQQLKVQEMAPGLDGSLATVDPTTGVSYDVPRASPLILAASLVAVDDMPLPFAKNRAELDSVLDMLDDEGLLAVGLALIKLTTAAPKTVDESLDAAKN